MSKLSLSGPNQSLSGQNQSLSGANQSKVQCPDWTNTLKPISKFLFRSTRLRVRDVTFLMVAIDQISFDVTAIYHLFGLATCSHRSHILWFYSCYVFLHWRHVAITLIIMWKTCMLLDFHLSVQVSLQSPFELCDKYNITPFQAENPHLRIFVLYLLRDPRASLADIKVKHVKEGSVWFDVSHVVFFPIMCVFILVFSGFGKVQGEGRGCFQRIWKHELQNGAFTSVIIALAHCLWTSWSSLAHLVKWLNVMRMSMFEIGIETGDPGPLHTGLRWHWTSDR